MDLAKDYKLKLKIEEFKKDTGLNDEQTKELILKTYFIKSDIENTTEMWREILKK